MKKLKGICFCEVYFGILVKYFLWSRSNESVQVKKNTSIASTELGKSLATLKLSAKLRSDYARYPIAIFSLCDSFTSTGGWVARWLEMENNAQAIIQLLKYQHRSVRRTCSWPSMVNRLQNSNWPSGGPKMSVWV